jgi:hypothetical protein
MARPYSITYRFMFCLANDSGHQSYMTQDISLMTTGYVAE